MLTAANVENLTGTSATAQTLVGLLGDDIYVVLNAGDTIVEAAGEGTDTIETALADYILSAANVENLTGTSNTGQSLRGSDGDNVITGGAGNDILGGGLGADTLIGGAGVDSFLFDTALGGGNIDAIDDFVSGTDRLFLDDTIFTQIGPGQLAPGAFVTGTVAGDADDRIIYDQATGALYYDADGNGAGAAIQFATLTGAPALTAADLFVI